MATKKKYIVETTVHGQEKPGGKKVVLLRSPKPQEVPAGLVKELLAEGLIKEVDGEDSDEDENGGGAGGTGAAGAGGAGGTGGTGGA